jgi:glycosyltransferase involved in cell wall biosynthesis
MKVLMTADTVGGVWTYTVELARALREHDVEIALFTMGKLLSDEQTAQIRKLPSVSLQQSEFKLEWMENPWADVRLAGRSLMKLGAQFCPDVVHLNGYAHAALPWSVPKLVVGHSCVLSWWKAVNLDLRLDPKWGRYQDEVARGLRAADFVVAPTKAMLSALKQCYGGIDAQTAVVPNGLDPTLLAPKEKQPFVFSAGRLWDPAKNIVMLQRVAPRLEWHVYAAGDCLGANESSADSGRPANYRSLGFLSREEMARWLSAASIYCAPARYEPFGLSILEAALSGCALVLGNIPSLREIWEGAAVFVDPTDADAITAGVQQLIANSVCREKCARRARLRALEFGPARMATRYVEIYRAMQLASNKLLSPRTEALACAS